MKFIISNNRIDEVEKIKDNLKKQGVLFKGLTLDGQEIEAYDLENGKLKPIVRDLLQEEGEGTNIKNIIIGILGIIAIFVIGIIFFIGDDIPKEEIKSINIQKIKEPVPEIAILKVDENINNKTIDNNSYNFELEGLKREAEIQTLKLTYDLQDLQFTNSKLSQENTNLLVDNQKLIKENTILIEKNKALSIKLVYKEKREIKYPSDAFIYYLGDVIYKECENENKEDYKEKCKTLYYNFMKNE